MARKSRLTELAERVRSAADLPGGPLVVALSGGADSAIAAWTARETGADVRAVHVHHGLPNSDVMVEAAGGVAARLGIPFEVARVRVPEGPSWEAQAREVRYMALLDRVGGAWLVTGHTADDQAETVLMNLLRGSGIDGLTGIPRRRHPVVRPLLAVWRDETRELATLLGLPWRDDPTNEATAALRNRIRRSLIPYVESRFSTGFRRHLVRTAALLAAEVEVLDGVTAIRPEVGDRRVRFVAGELAAVPEAVASRVVRRAMREGFGPHPPGLGAVEAVLKAARGEAHGEDLGGGLSVRRDGPWVEIDGSSVEARPSRASLLVPGESRWGTWRFEIVVGSRRPIVPLSPSGLVWPVGDRPLAEVRPAAEGGAIGIGDGSKRIQGALAEAGVRPERRPGWPVVEIDGVPVWLPWVRRAVWPDREGPNYLCAIASEEPWWDGSGP